jgi:hypothetical protein
MSMVWRKKYSFSEAAAMVNAVSNRKEIRKF